MVIFLALVILLPLLIQGAYYPTIFLATAVPLSCVALLKKPHKLSQCEQLLWGIAGFYLIASLSNGYASDSLAHACLPLVCSLFLYLYSGLSVSEKSLTRNYLVIGGSLLAGLSILAYCGIIPLLGSVASHRLQSTFQYANAAGSWFAALAVLTLDQARIRKLCLPIITALFLTQSVGALGLYAATQLIWLWKNNKSNVFHETVFIHIFAAVFSFGFYHATSWIAGIIMLLMCLFIVYWEKFLLIVPQVHSKWIVVFGTGIAAILLLFNPRFISSLSTFTERLVQISDGIRLIAVHPILGIGAGNWEVFYPYYQSAQYTSAVVHSGIIQVGVDSGIITMITVILFSVIALKIKGRSLSESLAVGLLMLHSLLDFTMQFFPIASLLLAILFAGEDKHEVQTHKQPLQRFLFLFSGILCTVMLYGQVQYRLLAAEMQTNSWEIAENNYEYNQKFFGGSWSARSLYIHALYLNGKLEKIINFTGNIRNLTAEEVLIRAHAFQQLGMQEQASQMLLEQLGQQIYRTALFTETAQLLLEWNADQKYLDEYNRLADIANNNQSILGALKGDQVYIEHIQLMEVTS